MRLILRRPSVKELKNWVWLPAKLQQNPGSVGLVAEGATRAIHGWRGKSDGQAARKAS